MNSLSNLINNKRFKELDEADRNIRTQILSNDARHIAQFDTPIKFQNKFQRMTAYEFQKGLELVKQELEGIIQDYNAGNLETTDNTGKLFSYWNTLMAYLKSMLLEGGVSNKDIAKINNLLDAIQPLVRDVASIAVEKDFVDKEQVDELLEKFDGNNWTPISKLQKKKSPDEIEAPVLEDDDEEAVEEEAVDIAPVVADEEEIKEEPVVETKEMQKLRKYERILQNLDNYDIKKLRTYHKSLFGKDSNSNDKYYLKNKIRKELQKLVVIPEAAVEEDVVEEKAVEEEEEEEEEDNDDVEFIDDEPIAVIANPFGMGKKYMKTNPAPLRYNNELDDYYLYQSMK